MKRAFTIILAVAALASVATLSSCRFNCKRGSGNQVTENRSLAGFSEIEISGDYQVNIKQDSNYAVNITADDNLMQYVKTEVNGDRLKIHTSRNICNAGPFIVNISLRELNFLRGSGAIKITSVGKITTKDLQLKLSGATKVNLDLNADNVRTTGSGLTEINLRGQASSHVVEMSGSGTLNALGFVVAKYSIESSGISHCKINVLNELNINSSGASDVQYKGNPSTVNNNKAGASTLQKID